MKISEHELSKLRSKALDFRKPQVDRMKALEHMAKLLLRRHGCNPVTNYSINVDTGQIEERPKA